MAYKNIDKRKEWIQKRQKRNRELYIKLKDVPCKDCDQKYPHYVMEFDHIPERGNKLNNISYYLANRSFDSPSVVKELAKCDIVCANCHSVRTYERNQFNRKFD